MTTTSERSVSEHSHRLITNNVVKSTSHKMRQYKIIAHILLVLPIINFVFALPIAGQETRQVCGDVVPDVAITISAKRGDEIEKGMFFESLSGRLDSHPAGFKGLQPVVPDHGSMDPPQIDTSEIQEVSPSCRNLRPWTIIWSRHRPKRPWTTMCRRPRQGVRCILCVPRTIL